MGRVAEPARAARGEGLGRRVALALSERGLSQSDLARMTGTSRSAICRIVRGNRTPSVETVGRIADALGLSTDYLIRGV